MTELLLGCPLLASVTCLCVSKTRRWLLVSLASIFGLFPLLVSLFALTEGTLPSLAILIPTATTPTAFLSFAGDGFSVALVTVTHLAFWSFYLYCLVEKPESPHRLSAIAFLQFCLSGLILAQTPLTLALFWIASALPHYLLTVESSRSDSQPLKPLATSLLSIGCFCAALGGIYPNLTVEFKSADATQAIQSAHSLLWGGLFVGIFSRLGIWPFHSWISWIALHCRPVLAAVLSLLFPLSGLVPLLLFQTQIPTLVSTIVVWIGLISLGYLALCSIGERELYRFLGYVRGATLSLILILLQLGASLDGLSLLIGAQTIALFALFLFFSGLSDKSGQTWVWKPDGSPGFEGVWHRYRFESLVTAAIIVSGLSVPSLTSMNPALDTWGVLRELSTSALLTVAFSMFALSIGLLEKYRAVFLTPGTRSQPIHFPILPLTPLLAILCVTSLLAIAFVFLGGL